MRALLKSGNLKEYKAIGQDGIPVYQRAISFRDSLERAAEVGPQFAKYLAVPEFDREKTRVDWYAPCPPKSSDGKYRIVKWSAASAEERQEALAKLDNLASVLKSYGRRLVHRKETGDTLVLAHFLTGTQEAQELPAIHFPNIDSVFIVDGEPVITFWGFVEGDSVLGNDPFTMLRPPKATSNTKATATGATTTATSASTLGATATAHHCVLWPWFLRFWPWLLGLLLLLLLISLLWWLFSKFFALPKVDLPFGLSLPGVEKRVDVVDPLAGNDLGVRLDGVDDKDTVIVDDDKALVVDQDRLVDVSIVNTDSSTDVSVDDGELVAPLDASDDLDDVIVDESQLPEESVVDEAEDASDSTLPTDDEELPNLPPVSDVTESPMDEGVDASADNEAIPNSNVPANDAGEVNAPIPSENRATDSVNNANADAEDGNTNSQVANPFANTDTANAAKTNLKASNTPLALDSKAVASGNLNAMQGKWVTKSGLMDKESGKPLNMSYDFDGKDSSLTIKRQDGVACSVKTKTQNNGGVVEIVSSGKAICKDNVSYDMPVIKCQQNSSGKTVCFGQYQNGSKFPIRMFKAEGN